MCFLLYHIRRHVMSDCLLVCDAKVDKWFGCYQPDTPIIQFPVSFCICSGFVFMLKVKNHFWRKTENMEIKKALVDFDFWVPKSFYCGCFRELSFISFLQFLFVFRSQVWYDRRCISRYLTASQIRFTAAAFLATCAICSSSIALAVLCLLTFWRSCHSSPQAVSFLRNKTCTCN